MLTFLKTEAKMLFVLQITISNQTPNGPVQDVYTIDNRYEYMITVLDHELGLRTYRCRVIGFTVRNELDEKAFVNYDSQNSQDKLHQVDTIKIDYSADGKSGIRSVCVEDIRDIVLYKAPGMDFERLDKIEDFK